MSNQSFSAVTPSDTSPLATPTRMFYVGVTGNIAVMGAGDTVATTFVAVPAGFFTFPQRVTQVMASGTTASGIVAVPSALGAMQWSQASL